MKKTITLLLCLLAAMAWAGESEKTATAPQGAHTADPWEKRLNAEGVLELEWDDLVPADFNPDTLFEQVAAKYGIAELDDNDPRAKEMMAEMQGIWSHAPVVKSLNGRRVRLPGLVVPLEGDGEKISEFLLVPYFGACIHVPPPPSNQIVYVKTGPKKASAREFYEAVQVTGRFVTEHSKNGIGDAGYTIEAETVEPYE